MTFYRSIEEQKGLQRFFEQYQIWMQVDCPPGTMWNLEQNITEDLTDTCC